MLLPPARVCEIGRAVDVPQRRIALTICAVTPRAVLNEKLCRIHLARRRSLTCSCVCAKKISADKNECRRQHGQLQKPSHFSNQRSSNCGFRNAEVPIAECGLRIADWRTN